MSRNVDNGAATRKPSFLWLPADATVDDLIACHLADKERIGVDGLRPCDLVRALGISRNSVARFDGRNLAYADGWRPILRELLALRVPVACKILATHVARRAGAAYVPTQRDFAADLGWTRKRVQRALARLVRAGVLEVTAENRRGCVYRQRRALAAAVPNRRSSLRQTDARGCTKPTLVAVPNRRPEEVLYQYPPTQKAPPGAPAAWRAPRMDGWADLRRAEILAQLEAGPHVGSMLAVLAVAGVFQRDRHARAIFAGELAEKGITTEQLVAGVLAAFDPLPSEGRVRSPGGLLRVWLERGEVPREPVPVGQVLRDAAERRRRADAAADAAAQSSAQAVARLRAELRRLEIRDRRLRGSDDVVNALEAALGRIGQRDSLGELYHLVYDRRGSLAELLELASRYASEPVLEALPAPLGDLALAEANTRRQTGDP